MCVDQESGGGGTENGECAAKDEKEHGKARRVGGHKGMKCTNRSGPHLTVSDIFLLSWPKRPRKRE
jgi:hypothetical protein